MSCDIMSDVSFFFNDTATTEFYTYCHTLSLHDALPIAYDGVGGDLELACAGLAIPDLGDAAGVREHELDLALASRAQAAGFDGRVADLPGGLVDDPCPGHVVEERSPAAGDAQFLAEPELFDRRIFTMAVAGPGP